MKTTPTLAAAALTLVVAGSAAPGFAQTITIVVQEEDAAPGGNGRFSGFEAPTLNDLGQAAFFGSLTGTAGLLIATIPEPATLALLAAGVPLVLGFRGRGRQADPA